LSFPRTYTQIREMIRKELLQTPMARAIVRKSGLMLGGGAFVGHPEVLLAQGWYSNANPDTVWETNATVYPSRAGVWGFWPLPSFHLEPDADPGVPGLIYPAGGMRYRVPGNYVYSDLRGVAFARAVVNISGGTGGPTLAFVPVYSAILNPMETDGETTGSLNFWYTPDGRTLFQWDEDIRPGGPRAFGWPPQGACQPLNQNPDLFPILNGCHAGKWAPPPREALNTDQVVVATALIANPTAEELDTIAHSYHVRSFVQVQTMAQETEAWRAHFADDIED
jgi:hypothetical protein